MHLFVAVIWLLGATQRSSAQVERELGWVERADPIRMANDSLRRGRIRFLAVCGYGCLEPGIGNMTMYRCYTALESSRIDSTGDVIVSSAHEKLKRKAYDFAKRYNIYLRDQLDRTNQRLCPASERWDEYWHALDSLVRTTQRGRLIPGVTATPREVPSEPDFLIRVHETLSTWPEVKARTCRLAVRYGIQRRVTFRIVAPGMPSATETDHFGCLRGAVAV